VDRVCVHVKAKLDAAGSLLRRCTRNGEGISGDSKLYLRSRAYYKAIQTVFRHRPTRTVQDIDPVITGQGITDAAGVTMTAHHMVSARIAMLPGVSPAPPEEQNPGGIVSGSS